MIKKYFRKNLSISSALFSLLIAAEFAVSFYFIKIYNGDYYLTWDKYVPLCAAVTLGLFISGICGGKKGPILSIICTILLSVSAYFLPKAGDYYKNNVVYDVPDTKSEVYSGKRVLLLVPHQDDEINVLGGVIEEYTKYGSEVFVAFSTNGDYHGQEELRFQEVEQVLGPLGVDKDHIIALGYGDNWQDGHLYDAEPDEPKVSHIGKTRTYGVGNFSAFDEDKLYTKNNFEEDIKNLILKYLPDIIFCVDLDSHLDHKALSMTFEKVMGQILAQTDYRPEVMKGFAYTTGWYAPEDYSDNVNVTSTEKPWDTEYMQENNIYLWKDRTRLPIRAESLARDIEMSPLYIAFTRYLTQASYLFAPGVINSDKVAWQRETGSLCYRAEITASSGEAEKLNDFMLIDSKNISDPKAFTDGTWIPDKDDTEKKIRIRFESPEDIQRIKFYDNPSLEDNIQEIEISFDDGTTMLFGPLMENGSETVLALEKENVSSVELKISHAYGDDAGLTEVEIFDKEKTNPFPFIKLIDEENNFSYDYLTELTELSFGIYSLEELEPLDRENYNISIDNKKCSAYMEDGKIKLVCPDGERCLLTVEHKESGLKDGVTVRNLNNIQKKLTELSKEHYLKQEALVKEQNFRFGKVLSKNPLGGVFEMFRATLIGY